jgi:hypothetical protein
MLAQVSSLGHNYSKWVNLPVDKPLRLFEHPILEKLSTSKWYYVPIYWTPIFFAFLHVHFSGKIDTISIIIYQIYKNVRWLLRSDNSFWIAIRSSVLDCFGVHLAQIRVSHGTSREKSEADYNAFSHSWIASQSRIKSQIHVIC